MTDADQYLEGLAGRLAADGCAVSREKIGLVGYKAQFSAPSLSRAHVFLIAGKAGAVDQQVLADFAGGAVELAVRRKGQLRGFQSAVIVLPVLVADSSDAGAVAITQRPHRLHAGGFAVMAQPALVDLAAGRAHRFRGVRIWGLAFNSMIKKKLNLYLPDPS
ncbi:MAG TPA: hypothetical protein VN408_09575 [Actinoplanes sp.]|nr:hypothetical protein [Actinoplanes sp.]